MEFEIPLWGSLIIANVYNANGAIFPTICWLIIAIFTLIISIKRIRQ